MLMAFAAIWTKMRGNRGFTLIELMVVCAVVAILVGVAAPSLNHFVQTNRLSNETNSLVSALNLARSEAINLRRPGLGLDLK